MCGPGAPQVPPAAGSGCPRGGWWLPGCAGEEPGCASLLRPAARAEGDAKCFRVVLVNLTFKLIWGQSNCYGVVGSKLKLWKVADALASRQPGSWTCTSVWQKGGFSQLSSDFPTEECPQTVPLENVDRHYPGRTDFDLQKRHTETSLSPNDSTCPEDTGSVHERVLAPACFAYA